MQPLVTVIVATYNSVDFVMETLESIRRQSWSNLELIITDDGSKDNTIELCSNWLQQHQQRFHKSSMVTTKKNTGTSGNLNRGLQHTTGEWVKIIAGDDYMYDNCIERLMHYAERNKDCKAVFCNITVNGTAVQSADVNAFFELNDAGKQYKNLLMNNILPVPGSFVKKELIDEVKGFDERFPLLEDYPFFLNILKTGSRLHFVNEPLVFYRVHENNISLEQKINFRYYKDLMRFYQMEYLPLLRHNRLWLYYIHYSYRYLLLRLIAAGVIKRYLVYDWLYKWGSILYWKIRIDERLLGKTYRMIVQ